MYSNDPTTRWVRIGPVFTEQQADELLTWLQITHIRLTEQEAPSAARRRLVASIEELVTELKVRDCIGRRHTHTVTYDPNGNRRHLPVCAQHSEPVPCIYCSEIGTPEG